MKSCKYNNYLSAKYKFEKKYIYNKRRKKVFILKF